MANFSQDEWNSLLAPYLAERAEGELLAVLEKYMSLLLRWNARMNLTAVREPGQIVARHFGESLFAARYVPRGTSSLLDHGSGAGFPGLPIALARPEISVTLAESQAKKATFLREAVRELRIASVQVHAARTETLPADLRFDVVTMRAVDNAAEAYPAAMARVSAGGILLALEGAEPSRNSVPAADEIPIPNSAGFLRIYPTR